MMRVTRTTVDIDLAALETASAALGTSGLSATVNTALREVGRRSALADFDVLRDVDGEPADVVGGREGRQAGRPT
jgi:Arc/MetJ family transcription regulator